MLYIYMYIYWVLPETFCSLGDDVLVCFQLSGSLLLLLFNYFSPLLFQLIYREFSDYYFITCITNPIKLLIWIFWQKQLTTEGHQSFVRISSSQVFDRVLNTPLRWCMWCNLEGIFLIKFLSFNIILFYLCIGNFFASVL